MNRYWLLREELYYSLHRWPAMLLFFTLGCVLGWAVSFLWPSYSRATIQIYVGLNPYRTYSDTNFLALNRPRYSNIDNYHHWQMSQLEGVTYRVNIIQETLTRLRQEDPYWDGVDVDQLQDMLNADWRSAGTWSLIGEHPDPNRASQAVEAWSGVVLTHTIAAIASSRNTFMIDQALQATATETLQSKLRLMELISTRSSLLTWNEAANEFPQGEPLPPSERWRILSLATRLADFSPVWMEILGVQPSQNAPPEEYIEWTSQIISLIDAELPVLEDKLTFLDGEHDGLSQEYNSESKKSLGLSPNIEIEGMDHLTVKTIRPSSTFILIGGTIGLLIWVLTQLVIISNKIGEKGELDHTLSQSS